jgi:hypothetical protein
MAAFFMPGLLIKNAQRIFGVGVRNHAVSRDVRFGSKADIVSSPRYGR